MVVGILGIGEFTKYNTLKGAYEGGWEGAVRETVNLARSLAWSISQLLFVNLLLIELRGPLEEAVVQAESPYTATLLQIVSDKRDTHTVALKWPSAPIFLLHPPRT